MTLQNGGGAALRMSSHSPQLLLSNRNQQNVDMVLSPKVSQSKIGLNRYANNKGGSLQRADTEEQGSTTPRNYFGNTTRGYRGSIIKAQAPNLQQQLMIQRSRVGLTLGNPSGSLHKAGLSVMGSPVRPGNEDSQVFIQGDSNQSPSSLLVKVTKNGHGNPTSHHGSLQNVRNQNVLPPYAY